MAGDGAVFGPPFFGIGLPDAFVSRVTAPTPNAAPVCSAVSPDPALLQPPNHRLRSVTLSGAFDPDGDEVTLGITSVTQDEPLNGLGEGDTTPDAAWAQDRSDQVLLRVGRSGMGDGRVYRIGFSASDPLGATCDGTVAVGVPVSAASVSLPVDSGLVFDSFGAP